MKTTYCKPAFVKEKQGKVREGGDCKEGVWRGEGEEGGILTIGCQCHLAHAGDETQLGIEPDASYYAAGMREVRVKVGLLGYVLRGAIVCMCIACAVSNMWLRCNNI